MEKQKLLVELYNADIIKYKPVVLKNGKGSNFYINARSICADPELFATICDKLTTLLRHIPEHYDCICGVPMGGITFSTIIAQNLIKPLTYMRKERKEHGLNRCIEGYYKKGAKCIMVEDVISTGSSCLENESKLIENGFDTVDIIATVFTRPGMSVINHKKIITLFTDTDIIDFHKNWEARLIRKREFQEHIKALRLIDYAVSKKTNICLSLDLTKCDDILEMAEKLGDHICMLKLHCDIIDDKSDKFFRELIDISISKSFVLCEDRKLGDIGNTMLKQFKGGEYPIEKYFDFVTIHAVSGQKSIEVLKSDDTSLLVVTDMSTEDNLMTDYYRESALSMTKSLKPYASGIVSQQNLCGKLLTFTPGIGLGGRKDGKGQQYNTPYTAYTKGTDFIIVGRSIYEAEDPVKAINDLKSS